MPAHHHINACVTPTLEKRLRGFAASTTTPTHTLTKTGCGLQAQRPPPWTRQLHCYEPVAHMLQMLMRLQLLLSTLQPQQRLRHSHRHASLCAKQKRVWVVCLCACNSGTADKVLM